MQFSKLQSPREFLRTYVHSLSNIFLRHITIHNNHQLTECPSRMEGTPTLYSEGPGFISRETEYSYSRLYILYFWMQIGKCRGSTWTEAMSAPFHVITVE
jgi:hypothetical protein